MRFAAIVFVVVLTRPAGKSRPKTGPSSRSEDGAVVAVQLVCQTPACVSAAGANRHDYALTSSKAPGPVETHTGVRGGESGGGGWGGGVGGGGGGGGGGGAGGAGGGRGAGVVSPPPNKNYHSANNYLFGQ